MFQRPTRPSSNACTSQSTLIKVRGVGNQFQKTTADSYKSDREMTVCEMQDAQDRARKDHDEARKTFETKLAKLEKTKAKLSDEVRNANTSAPWDIGLGRLYCGAVGLILPRKRTLRGRVVRQRAASHDVFVDPFCWRGQADHGAECGARWSIRRISPAWSRSGFDSRTARLS